jgi:hypothetical protein
LEKDSWKTQFSTLLSISNDGLRKSSRYNWQGVTGNIGFFKAHVSFIRRYKVPRFLMKRALFVFEQFILIKSS